MGEDITANTFMPDDVELSGDCSEEDIETLTMKFKGFTLYMVFRKTPGGERWYVSTIDLTYSSSNELLKLIDRPNLEVSVNNSFLIADYAYNFNIKYWNFNHYLMHLIIFVFQWRWNCQMIRNHCYSQRQLENPTCAMNLILFYIHGYVIIVHTFAIENWYDLVKWHVFGFH